MADMGLAGLFSPEEAISAVPASPPPAPAPPAPVPQPEPPATAEASTTPGGPPSGRIAQAWHMLRLAYYQARRTWRDARNHPGGPIWKIEHFRPPSIADQIAYRDGRGWVPAGWYSGWSEKWGVAYHTWVATPALVPLNCLSWLVIRPFRMLVFLLCLAVAIFLVAVLHHFGVISAPL